MIKTIMQKTWFVDLEWVPDAATGRRAFGVPESTPDHDVIRLMWDRAGATATDPRPYLKTALCRIVFATALVRTERSGGRVSLQMCSSPRIGESAIEEMELISRFLGGLERSIDGPNAPMLVGFNIAGSDIPILLQRGVAAGVIAAKFAARPNKPWEGKDYFAKNGSDYLLDLCESFGGWGAARASLNELASACNIPGKLGVDGSSVVDLWRAGKVDEIVAYNQFDVLTTYLLWLQAVRFAGLLSPSAVEAEERLLREELERRSGNGEAHFQTYLNAWTARLQAVA